jgi:cobalamin synthase
MTKPKALTLGVFTVWPIIYIFLFVGVMFSQVFMMEMGNHAPQGQMPLIMKIILPLHFLTMIWIFVLIAVYIRHIFKTEAVPQDKKALWAVVIFCGNMIAMPVYWYLYIWKKVENM